MIKLATIFFSIILALGGMYAISLGVERQWTQHDAITTWPGVDGTILSSRLTTSRGSKGSTDYHATIEYHYVVATSGQAGYRQFTLLPIGDAFSNSHREANRRLSLFPAGSTTKVFYNPDQPSQSFILREYQSWPPALVNGGVALVACSAWMLLRLSSRASQTTIAVDREWVRLMPSDTIAELKRAQITFAIVSALLPVAPALHALTAPATDLGIVFWSIVGVSALWLGYAVWRVLMLMQVARSFTEPEVFMTPSVAITGRPLMLMIDAKVKDGVSGAVSATLLCENVRHEGSGKSRREVRDRLLSFDAVPGREGGLIIDTTIPPEAPVSSTRKSTPRIEWRLDVNYGAALGVHHTAKYPMQVG